MTAKNQPNAEERDIMDAEGTLSLGLNDEEWETEQDETPDRLIFDTIGDEYAGLYLGSEVITYDDPKEGETTFTQLHFWDEESPKVINAGYKLLEAFAKVEPGREARIRYVKDVNVGQASGMKDFKVWSRPARAAWLDKAIDARTKAGLA